MTPHTITPAAERGWEHFEHAADIGVRGWGPTREAAFEEAALALTAVVTDPAGVTPRERAVIACEAPDAELLLADWLNAVVYEMAVRRLLFGRYTVRVTPAPADEAAAGLRLEGEAWGEPVDMAAHEPAVEVKGATYTGLRVTEAPHGRWVAQCVVDV